MNILIIGNGFDLAHGLPTKYKDFLDFIEIYDILNSSNLENIKKNKLFLKLHQDIKEYLESEEVSEISNHNEVLAEFDFLIRGNLWIDYFKNKKETIKENWIDFEKEISEVIKALENLKQYNVQKAINIELAKDSKNNDSNSKARIFLNDYCINNEMWGKELMAKAFIEVRAQKIIQHLECEIENLIRCLEIYLEVFVDKIKIDKRLKDIEVINSNTPINKVLSFNYTDTYKDYYDKFGAVEYDYIHGNLNVDNKVLDNNMVLGIDEYLTDEEKDIQLDFIKFKKYFQRIYKKTGCKYKEWIENINNKDEINNIYIYGHSLDITDKDILKELILCDNVITNIYYLDKPDYSLKIINMIKIIGQDELTKRVHGARPSIIFKSIQK